MHERLHDVFFFFFFFYRFGLFRCVFVCNTVLSLFLTELVFKTPKLFACIVLNKLSNLQLFTTYRLYISHVRRSFQLQKRESAYIVNMK